MISQAYVMEANQYSLMMMATGKGEFFLFYQSLHVNFYRDNFHFSDLLH